jgi:uncharacterized protein
MPTEKIFLTARWENLVLITYKISPEMLEPFLPKGLEPDTIDGDAFVSLVAFDFLDTKVKGIKFPYHVNFPEINLRAYVRYKEKRGVIFIREFVPRFFISLIANSLYNEKYVSVPMKSHIEKNGSIFLSHTLTYDGKDYSISLQAENKPWLPPDNSREHFFKEHEWGFGTNRAGKLLTYRVEHPFWDVYPITKFEHNFDLSAIYGKQWQSLNNEFPYNITFAKGSKIKVFKGKIINQP